MARILIVDDLMATLELARTILESLGHEVVEASSGKEAVALALYTLPDLILLDVHMPGLDGLQTLVELRNNAPLARTPVVAFTANAMKGEDRQLLEAGFSGYISKPVSLNEFRRQIRSFISVP